MPYPQNPDPSEPAVKEQDIEAQLIEKLRRMKYTHRADIGDLVVVFVSGAYGFSASPRGFLSHPEPLEFFLPG